MTSSMGPTKNEAIDPNTKPLDLTNQSDPRTKEYFKKFQNELLDTIIQQVEVYKFLGELELQKTTAAKRESLAAEELRYYKEKKEIDERLDELQKSPPPLPPASKETQPDPELEKLINDKWKDLKAKVAEAKIIVSHLQGTKTQLETKLAASKQSVTDARDRLDKRKVDTDKAILEKAKKVPIIIGVTRGEDGKDVDIVLTPEEVEARLKSLRTTSIEEKLVDETIKEQMLKIFQQDNPDKHLTKSLQKDFLIDYMAKLNALGGGNVDTDQMIFLMGKNKAFSQLITKVTLDKIEQDKEDLTTLFTATKEVDDLTGQLNSTTEQLSRANDSLKELNTQLSKFEYDHREHLKPVKEGPTKVEETNPAQENPTQDKETNETRPKL